MKPTCGRRPEPKSTAAPLVYCRSSVPRLRRRAWDPAGSDRQWTLPSSPPVLAMTVFDRDAGAEERGSPERLPWKRDADGRGSLAFQAQQLTGLGFDLAARAARSTRPDQTTAHAGTDGRGSSRIRSSGLRTRMPALPCHACRPMTSTPLVAAPANRPSSSTVSNTGDQPVGSKSRAGAYGLVAVGSPQSKRRLRVAGQLSIFGRWCGRRYPGGAVDLEAFEMTAIRVRDDGHDRCATREAPGPFV